LFILYIFVVVENIKPHENQSNLFLNMKNAMHRISIKFFLSS
jgi:hypothetical protein